MESGDLRLGIVGGSGMLGRAIAHAVLKSGAVRPETLWISNRRGSRDGFEAWPRVTITTDNQALAEACDAILLCVPPAHADSIGIDAPDSLMLSVMAGVSIDRIRSLTGAARVARAMSSPAAERHLAYSPWVASPEIGDHDRVLIRAVFGACGPTDEVDDEGQIEVFTALTGPVPGFVAFFAECMAGYAESRGVSPETADRAIRQLFLSAGTMMMEGEPTPADHVQEMIDYAGTTAAGLSVLRASPIAEELARGLDAAVARTRGIG